MSADNFNYIRKTHDSRWAVWLNLSASNTRSEQTIATKPDRIFDDLEAASKWTEDQGWTEYGTEIEHDPDADDPVHVAADAIMDTLSRFSGPDAAKVIQIVTAKVLGRKATP